MGLGFVFLVLGKAEASGSTTALPKPTEVEVELPELAALEMNKLLDVSGFKPLRLGWF